MAGVEQVDRVLQIAVHHPAVLVVQGEGEVELGVGRGDPRNPREVLPEAVEALAGEARQFEAGPYRVLVGVADCEHRVP